MERLARMTEELTEKDLLAECKNGNRQAFEWLYQTHQKRVFSVAVNFFGGDEALAKDVTQAVFLKMLINLTDFRGEANLTTWLYRMTVNACIDEQRKHRRFFSIDSFFAVLTLKKPQDDEIQREEISAAVQKAVAGLKPKFRLPILLKYVENLSYQEIAQVLQCSTGTVASRLNRGHKMLAGRLGHLKDEVQ